MTTLYADLGNDFSYFVAVEAQAPTPPAADNEEAGADRDELTQPAVVAKAPRPAQCLASDVGLGEGEAEDSGLEVGERPRRSVIFWPKKSARRYLRHLGQEFDARAMSGFGTSAVEAAALSTVEQGGTGSKGDLSSLSHGGWASVSARTSGGPRREVIHQITDEGEPVTTLAAKLLVDLKRRAEDEVGHGIHQAMLVIPASMGVAARRNLRDAAQIAGLDRLSLVHADAVALERLADQRPDLEEGVAVVVDVGSTGTRVSVARHRDERWSFSAFDSDDEAGGDAMDQAIVGLLSSEVESIVGSRPSDSVRARVLDAARKLRERFEDVEARTLHLPHLCADESGARHFRRELSSREVAAVLNPIFERILRRVRRCIERASLDAESMSELVLLGGACRAPALVRGLRKLCPNAQLTTMQRRELAEFTRDRADLEALDQLWVDARLTRSLDLKCSTGEQSPLLAAGRSLPAKARWTPAEGGAGLVTIELLQSAAQSERAPEVCARWQGHWPEDAALELSIDASGRVELRRTGVDGGEVVELDFDWVAMPRDQQRAAAYAEAVVDHERALRRLRARATQWTEASAKSFARAIEARGDKMDQLVATRLRTLIGRLEAAANDPQIELEALVALHGELHATVENLHAGMRGEFAVPELDVSIPDAPTPPIAAEQGTSAQVLDSAGADEQAESGPCTGAELASVPEAASDSPASDPEILGDSLADPEHGAVDTLAHEQEDDEPVTSQPDALLESAADASASAVTESASTADLGATTATDEMTSEGGALVTGAEAAEPDASISDRDVVDDGASASRDHADPMPADSPTDDDPGPSDDADEEADDANEMTVVSEK